MQCMTSAINVFDNQSQLSPASGRGITRFAISSPQFMLEPEPKCEFVSPRYLPAAVIMCVASLGRGEDYRGHGQQIKLKCNTQD
eukprot:1162113-Pelagomonas_calceolata.AAC.14